MAYADFCFLQQLLNGGGKIQQAHHIGYHRARLAHVAGNHLLLHPETRLQQAVLLGFLQRGQILTLQVFNEGELGYLQIRGIVYHYFYLGLPQAAHGA